MSGEGGRLQRTQPPRALSRRCRRRPRTDHCHSGGAATRSPCRYNRLGRPEENHWQTMAGLIDQRWGTDYLTGAGVIKV